MLQAESTHLPPMEPPRTPRRCGGHDNGSRERGRPPQPTATIAITLKENNMPLSLLERVDVGVAAMGSGGGIVIVIISINNGERRQLSIRSKLILAFSIV